MRILALDGGPGPAFMVRLLEGLEQRSPGFLESVDMFSGTSDGALMSLYLAQALTRKQAPLEAIRGCIQFNEELFRVFQTRPGDWVRFLSGSRALFNGRAFYELMQRTFGDTLLADLEKKVLLVGFDASTQSRQTFCAFPPRHHHPSSTLVDVALATSAFPLLLPGYVAKKGKMVGKLVLDGALSNNSVGMAALSGAADFLTDNKQGLLTSGTALPQVKLLSMGLDPTVNQQWLMHMLRHLLPGPVAQRVQGWLSSRGERPIGWNLSSQYRGGMVDRGWLWFGVNVLPSMVTLLQGTTRNDVANLQQLLGEDHYFRFDPTFDAAHLVVTNLFSTQDALRKVQNWVEQFWASESGTEPPDALALQRKALLQWIDTNWFAQEGVDSKSPEVSGD